jgi:hypothetical protein
MFSKFLLIVGITVILFLAGGFFLPRYVHVERSLEIERPAAPVFALLNSYKTFASWSPWAERDPDARYEFTGPEAGVGARMSWSGDPRLVGSGWQEIIESVPHSLVRTRMFFDQQGAAESYFRLDETPRGVMVTWAFDTDLTEGQSLLGGLLARYFGLMFDRWIGSDYEQGLARLKQYAESLPVTRPPRAEIEVIEVAPQPVLYRRIGNPAGGNPDAEAGIAESLAHAFAAIDAYMVEQGLSPAGRPMAINHSGGQGYELLAAIPVSGPAIDGAGSPADDAGPSARDGDSAAEVATAGGMQPELAENDGEPILSGYSPAGRAVRIVHRGPYNRMADSYQKLAAYMEVHDLSEGDYSWEQYVSDPASVQESELLTHIYFLVSAASGPQ